jgi:hypothetical protein
MHVTHQATIAETSAYLRSESIGARVTELFVTAVATGFHRGLTPIAAYYSFAHLQEHPWEPFHFKSHNRSYPPEKVPCAVCGLVNESSIDEAYLLADLACGRCALAPCNSHFVDLRDLPNLTAVYQNSHVYALYALLAIIASAPAGETPSALEKRVSRAKILPKSNLASRLWCLRILAELGVITNQVVPGYSGARHFYNFTQRAVWENDLHKKSGARADPVWPLSAWRGGGPVDWEIARRLFPQLKQ